jgi:hypothetical protein
MGFSSFQILSSGFGLYLCFVSLFVDDSFDVSLMGFVY